MHMPTRPSNLFIISLLGALSVITPFSIDMYLPAFSQVGHDLGVSTTTISLTLSSYFIGMALGQVFYGPLLDRFGRKKPLLGGLCIYILASIGCAFAPNIHVLVALRFIQAMGGCSAGVASLAMVRDFFPPTDSAKILSRLFLFIAVSPLLAPTTGGFVALWLGWKAVFIMLALIVAAIVVLIVCLLPESHTPDPSISLRPGPIFTEYMAIARHPRFITYALSGAFSFAGLFTYVAGSPIVFMEGFHLSAQAYSGIFALLATGFIGGSQVNVELLKRYDSETLFFRILSIQTVSGLVFVLGAWAGWWNLYSTIALFYVFLSCAGLTYPNAAGIAIAPFTRNAGSAAAMLGFIQLGVGATISTGISMSKSHDSFPIIAIMGITAAIGFAILMLGRERAHRAPAVEQPV